MKKLTKTEEKFENMVKTLKEANDALRNGFGPAHNSNNLFLAIPGIIEYDAFFDTDVYYALIVEKSENGGAKPVDWYSWASNANSKRYFQSGFGGYHNDDYATLIKYNPWIKDEWDSLRK